MNFSLCLPFPAGELLYHFGEFQELLANLGVRIAEQEDMN